MSFRALFAAWQTPTNTANGFAVMMALAGHHNDETELCCPSQTTIALRTKLSTDTVGRAIKELEAEGLIRRHVRRDAATGARISDRYDLLFASPRQLALILVQQADSGQFEDLTRNLLGGDLATLAPVPPNPHGAEGSKTAHSGDPPRTQRHKSGRESGNLPGAKAPGATKDQVEAIWSAIPDQRSPKGVTPRLPDIRKRSESRAVIEKALSARLREGHSFERVLAGVQAYYADPEVAKDGPSGPYHFAAGAQRVLTKGLWLTYLEADSHTDGLRDLASVTSDGAKAEPPGGYVADWQARVWLSELNESPASWRSERGPLPGQPGCRVRPEIQRAFGFRPVEDGPKEGPNDA